MKKLILISAMIFICAYTMAQSNTTRYIYCELIGVSKMLSSKIIVTIDFGQYDKFFVDKRLKDETGKPIEFNSMIDAMNFMGDDGWEFVQAFVVSSGQSSYVYHWILKKRKL
jgi:hypothetical protein